jgi:multiple sugar transport system ATP-binding protein
MFVADFIGSPPMNFLPLHSSVSKGTKSLRVNGATIAVPEIREDVSERELALGVRPEYVSFDDASPLKGRVFGAEYRGTTQIVTVTTDHGQLKARLPASLRADVGEIVGLTFRGERFSLFEKKSGRAIAMALGAGGVHG